MFVPTIIKFGRNWSRLSQKLLVFIGTQCRHGYYESTANTFPAMEQLRLMMTLRRLCRLESLLSPSWFSPR